MINETKYWEDSIPHETSGPCYTYNPPFDSDPAPSAAMHLTLNATDWNPELEIFLHKKGKFFYQSDETVNTIKLSPSELNAVMSGHPRISGKPNE